MGTWKKTYQEYRKRGMMMILNLPFSFKEWVRSASVKAEMSTDTNSP